MRRTAGMLMPISSLPSPYGIGTLGKAAYEFADFLRGAHIGIWQVLPVQPTSYGDSPYSSSCASALNPYFIDLDMLVKSGLLKKEECESVDWGDDPRRVDYGKLYMHRAKVLRLAFSRFDKTSAEWRGFLKEGKYRDFALYASIKESYGGAPCEDWGEYSEYSEEKAEAFCREHSDEVEFWQFTQYMFLKQWRALKDYCHERGVLILGDIPIYVARDSVEYWKYKEDLFLLDKTGKPESQAGVPPDAFSDTGQLWGNPVYNWSKMKANGYRWWHNRIEEALSLYDILRIDHFIGFVRYYSIPSTEKDARNGKWREGPGAGLFKGFEGRPIIAEDLGVVTEEVRAAIRETGYPGMKILQHAFDGDPGNEHRPSNYIENCVAYTGTHDNETLFTRISNMGEGERKVLVSVLKEECKAAGIPCAARDVKAICGTILRLLFACRADTVVFPLADALKLGEEARINAPSTISPLNWSIRFTSGDIDASLKRRLARNIIKSARG